MKSLVLLSTFNGEQFLEDQLRSLQKQTHTDWYMLVRDDGSTDRSVEILQSFASSDLRIKILDSGKTGKNLGPVSSYAFLLKESLKLSDWHWLHFCDQDDIWLEYNILEKNRCLQKLQELHPNTPLLVHTDAQVVDQSNALIHNSFKDLMNLKVPLGHNLKSLIVENCVTACTVAINRDLARLSDPIPDGAIMHDHWIALLAQCTGIIHYNEKKLMRYRQHHHNTVGALKAKKTLVSTVSALSNTPHYVDQFLRVRKEQAIALRERLQNVSSNNYWDRWLGEFVDCISIPRLSSVLNLLKKGVCFSSFRKTLGFYFLLLWNAIRQPKT